MVKNLPVSSLTMRKCDPIRALQETQRVIQEGLCHFHLVMTEQPNKAVTTALEAIPGITEQSEGPFIFVSLF